MTAAIHRLHLWWRRAARHRTLIAAAIGVLFLVLILTVRLQPRPTAVFPLIPAPVDLTPVQNAQEKGAVCLDGSTPHYHLDRGFGSGSDSWLLHLEGGGWCNTVKSCSIRARTSLGSSRYMDPVVFYGILSPLQSQNPDFYNWNRVKVRYCDGASFKGDVGGEVQNRAKLFFRGQRIWEAVMSDLMSKGLADAKKAFLTGCSAGGLATFLHCDNFRLLLPKVGTVKCLADAGFFLDEQCGFSVRSGAPKSSYRSLAHLSTYFFCSATINNRRKDVSGERTMQSRYKDVVRLQNVEKSLPKDCLSTTEPTQCFFPREIIQHITTPFFILNPAYDYWQIQNVLAPYSSDPQQKWLRCKLNVHNCDASQIQVLQEFRTSLLDALKDFQKNKQGGMYINSCFIHCQTMNNITWHSPDSPRTNNKTIAEAVGDWFFDRREVKEVDCAYPCNPSCYNLIMTEHDIKS